MSSSSISRGLYHQPVVYSVHHCVLYILTSVHTHINTDNNTLWDICYQVEPLFENFQILESVTFKYLPNGTKNILKKTFDQNCECCCQSSVFEFINRASYDAHLYKCDKCYPKLAPKMSG